MTAENQALGTCPFCDARVPQHKAIIEYEKNGEKGVFAECPECGEVVDPQNSR